MIENPGYHLEVINRGIYGEISKVIEEAEELKDAMMQGNKIMILLELSDMVGAIQGYLEKYYGNKMGLSNLESMAEATSRAFKNGERT